ncbi:sulfatase [Pelagicoccus enzymogenes]|uniref:sulfatase n=1 Tax=Pelagicoccus enzymogenes TaxID=2773457 RepID=UPI00281062B4|nr:sulfatase [Pelagicoccus enzymogenes]MDQ8199410.1 sulfatase [Pelagicoccus enzymogenes]
MKNDILMLSFAAAVFSICFASNATDTKPPNVLFIAVDDLRNELGLYGDPLVKSPNLDRLAEKGVVFEHAYCQQALCNPSRASALSGLRPDTLRVWDLPTHFRDTVPEVVTLPQHFRANGYYTQNIGKIFHNWRQDLEGDPVAWSVPAVMHFNSHYNDEAQVEGPLPPNLATARKCEMRDVPDDAYFDGRIANLAVEALQDIAQKDDPFFLAIGFWKPHAPFNAPKRYWDLYEREQIPLPKDHFWPEGAPEVAWHNSREILGSSREQPSEDEAREIRHGYMAAISYMDAQVGKVLDELNRLGMEDDTIVVFWSDHGFHMGEHTLWAKTSNFEYDARVPLVISAPGMTTAGERSGSLAELLDLYPTLVELCGLTQPDVLEGISLVPILQDVNAVPRRYALSQHPRPAYYKGAPDAMGYSLRSEAFRYTEWRDWQSGDVFARELYDHRVDPGETRNVSGRSECADDVGELSVALESFNPIVIPGWDPVLSSE